MDKIVVDIYIPAINKTYDFILPCYMNIKQLIGLIGKTISEHENMIFDFDDLLLFSVEKGKVLDPSLTLAQINIEDGSRLTVV